MRSARLFSIGYHRLDLDKRIKGGEWEVVGLSKTTIREIRNDRFLPTLSCDELPFKNLGL